MTKTMKKHLLSRSLVAAGTMALAVSASAGLTIERSKAEPKPETSKASGPAFNADEYLVMADQSYQALLEYGNADNFKAAPSYGDTMPLADALNLLLPEGWKALRNRATQASMKVSWDISEGDWRDVLRNLGARHGLQFHVDHTSKKVFIREGRKLLVEPESEIGQSGRFASEGESTEPQPDYNQDPQPVNSSISGDKLTFDVNGGDDGERVMNDLAMLMGYDQLYWMTAPKVFPGSEVIKGGPKRVIQQLSTTLGVKSCVYDGNSSVIAVVSKQSECPQ